MQTNAATIDPTVENMKKRNQTSTADRIHSYLRHPGSGVLALLTVGAAIVTLTGKPPCLVKTGAELDCTTVSAASRCRQICSARGFVFVRV